MTNANDAPAYTRSHWAKSDRQDHRRIHLLEHHLADVGACFEELLAQPTIRQRLAHSGGLDTLDDATAARLALFAALHDIGKVNTGFQTQIWRDADLPAGQRRPGRAGHTLDLTPLLNDKDEETGRRFFDALGWWLEATESWDDRDGETVSALFIAALSHHGLPLQMEDGRSRNPAIWRSFGGLDPEACVRRIGGLARQWFPAAFAPNAPPLPSDSAFQHHFLGLCYQWQADGADISGATASTYTLADADKGAAISVTVSFTDDAGNEESLTSAATAAVAAATEEGEEPTDRPHRLTAEASGGAVVLTWKAPEGYRSDYRILRNRPELGEAEPLVYVAYTDTTDVTYTDTDVEPGVLYVYSVTALDFLGDAGEASRPVEIRMQATSQQQTANSPATGAPAITGTAQVGETLTADTSGIADADGLSNAVFSYQWQAGGADISGATGSTYTLADADEGKAISVAVSFTDNAGNAESVASAATAAVEARPNRPATGALTITGAARVGELLTADVSEIADADGLEKAAFAYQWQADSTDLSGATDSSYTLAASDEGKAISVTVSFTDYAGHEESFTSTATAAVVAAAEEDEEPTDRPHGLTAEASDGAVVLTWTAPVVDYQVSSYHILRHRPEQGEAEPLVYVDQTPNKDTSYTDTDVEAGVLYVYRVKAIVNWMGDLGDASDAAQIRVQATAQEQTANNPATGAPTITGKAQVGEMLTADVSGISDDDGLSNAVFSYQWQADGADISSATSDTYTLADADEGKAISVKVSFTDDAGNAETLTSAATAAAEAKPNTPATGQPTISGTAQVGQTHVRHRRCGRLDQRRLQLPVAGGRRGNIRDDRFHIHPGRRRRGQGHKREGVLQRRRGERGDADQRGDGGGGIQAEHTGHGRAYHQRYGPGGSNPGG